MFVNQNPFSDVLYFYQKKIGHLDQQQWEKSVEERVLNGINLSVTKKVNKLKNSLIDLDYIRGSAFNKNKPKHSWLSITCYGIVRVVCFPFYWNWWIDQTNRRISCVLLTLYLLQLCSMFVYFNDDQFNDKKLSQAIPPSEVLTPLFMFFFLSILYSQIFASSSNHFANRGKSYLKPNALNNSLEEKLEEQKAQPANKENNNNLFDLDDQYSDRAGKQTANCKRTANGNAKFAKLSNKNGRLKFKTCPTRTRTTLRTSKCDANKRKRHLTGDTSSATIQISAYQEEKQRLVLHKSDNNLLEKNALSDDLKELLDANSNDNLIENSTENLNDRLEPELKKLSANRPHQKEDENLQSDLHNLQIKCESNNYLDLTTSEDCSPYSSISSSANLKLLLKQKEDDEKAENGRKDEAHDYSSKPNYFEQRIYQPQKTRYYYFKEVVNESNGQTGYPTFTEDQPNFQRKITDVNDDSNDSENGSISPTTPMKSLNDWPMINSENSTEDDEEEEVLINVEEEQKAMPVKQSSDSNDNCPDSKRLNSLTSKNLSLFPDDSIDKISCTIFQEKEWQKIDLSMIDISSLIIKKVDTTRYSNEYFYFAILFSLLFAFIPQIFRFQQLCTNLNSTEFLQSNTVSLSNLDKQLVNCDPNELNILDAYGLRKNESEECRILKSSEDQKPSRVNKSAFVCGAINASNSSEEFIEYLNYLPIVIFDLLVDVFKNSVYSFQMKFIVFVALFERFTLSLLFFILLCVAERTYRERFLYAKYFCHLTSARRAKRNELPHFRLNKVQNIKNWLSIRSFLKKHGPQRSVDSIVSTSFILAVSLLTFLCIQLLRENDIFSESLCCYEMVVWVLTCGIFIMRLIVLGSKMNRKYKSNLSVLITEQINLYLQLEQKPHKKEKLQLANNVLKLAADLLKQLEVPFKISGFSANPYLYNIVKVIVLSAFSAVLSEVLGFKLKLYKIKISA